MIVKAKTYNWHLKPPNDLFLYASMDIEAEDGTKTHLECGFPPTLVINDAWKVFGWEDLPDYVDRQDIPLDMWNEWESRKTKIAVEKYQFEKERVIIEQFRFKNKLTDEQINEVLKLIPA